jgi:hypothetical protein
MHWYKLINQIAIDVFDDENVSISDMITGLNYINISKLSSVIENIDEINLYYNHNEEKAITVLKCEFMDILFQKYGYLFKNLENMTNGMGFQKMHIPSRVKKLTIQYSPDLVLCNEKLNVEEFICEMPMYGISKIDLNEIFNFESIKVCSIIYPTAYWSLYIEKMINLETLDIGETLDSNEIGLNICHLDKLTRLTGYDGKYELPKSITTLYYSIYDVRPLPPKLEKLHLNFFYEIGFAEFSNDNVIDVSIRTTVLIDGVHCYFPDVTHLIITNGRKIDNNIFVNRMLSNYKKLEKLQIDGNNDLINNMDIKDLIIKNHDGGYYCMKSDIIEKLCIMSNTNKIELKTEKLSVLEILQKSKSSDLIVSIQQDKILDQVSIFGDYGTTNLSELTIETLSLDLNIDSILIPPSYCKHLRIFRVLSSSWLNYDIEILTINLTRFHNRLNKITIDCENIYVPHLKKIIIVQYHYYEKFEWNEYFTVSNECEIEYEMVEIIHKYDFLKKIE